ncbi:MAG: DNA repair protein RecN [Thermoleophilaceae bacterium]|nr:DNA repair protein RecN [Thermoleophilaceae bacterium]
MLLELRVENLLLIERAELRLGPGLNAITGETGAGKTVLAHALDLLLGGKPRAGIVRPGADEAYVEGAFAWREGLLDGPELEGLRDLVPEGAEEIVLGRRVSAAGRSRAFVQGRSATAGDLQVLGRRLVAFYGQHEHRKLTVSSAQLEALDGFAGEKHRATVASYAGAHAGAAAARRELEALRSRAGERDRDLDLLVFEIEEIEALEPTVEERESLRGERERLRHLEALRAASGGAAEALAPDAPDGTGASLLLAGAENLTAGVEGVDADLDALAKRLAAVRIEADELAADLRAYESGLEGEPGRLEQVEERLEAYDRLERKHGGSVEAVLAHLERCRAERDRLENAEVVLEQAQAAVAEAEAQERKLAAAVSAGRRKAAPKLDKRVLAELRELAMEDASFEVRLEEREALAGTGAERVEFLIAPNPGVPAAPLRETASGGELSRVMLALMSVAAANSGPTLVFDEVDAGIGGQTARAVGERLRSLAEGHQVLTITHLPQIASLAGSHFRIAKDTGADLARTSVSSLEGDAVVGELVRMLGAESGDAGARKHAKELLAAA